jgi:class I fructose-bisphosphate aldolase
MNTGKQVRLNRLFSHPSGRLCGIAVDHFFNYGAEQVPPGLRAIGKTLAQIVAGQPDSVTMHRGIAATAWKPFAGKVPFILQSSIVRYDDSCEEQLADPEDAVRLGADAFAVAAFVRGPNEGRHLRVITECVKAAARWEMPVVVHIYPRTFEGGTRISFQPEDIAWAVRCALECGVDVIKTPYCGDVKAYRQIVSDCPVPIVAAGGPQTKTLADALGMLRSVVQSGARGAVVGRNVWGAARITETVLAMKAVIHDNKSPQQALKRFRG